MKNWMWTGVCAALLAVNPMMSANAGSRLGLGLNYWVALDDVEVDDVDENGFSYYLTYQYHAGKLIGFQADLEFIPSRFGNDAWAPQGYLVLGNALYAAVGAGWVYTDGSFADEPFFAFRAGLDLEVLPGIHLDLNANYRFNDKTDLEGSDTNIDTDTIFFGAALRFGF
ncbi:MAG TPA: outer membrane beta-barrel protein [Kiritimatiellia bacterium]|nr:outer membrane beta-barrel protein [Kiritimatiellia bacterium]